MVKIGMMIGGRYEILEKIGNGGMSDVYKAKCHKLNRYVAIKVLKQEFSENANFVSKFRIEAQAAAGLMHPNIVNVYDVGEENGIYYIVMELVEGITLKKYIEKKARLSYKEAVSIAIQVSMGIEAAHRNHIIHRDIKPQNIIISRDGKVKVTDFGIAKAATSNTITSNVMGSVHYTSPEQARGGYSDEKSDIYSLGITLFEMLTGRLPFTGETTVAIAIKQIQDEMPSPREYVPEVPYSVEQIVLKCCQKSPDRRYQNVADLITDLKQSLVDPEGDFVSGTEQVEGDTKDLSDQDIVQIKRRTRGKTIHEDEELMRLNHESEEEYDEEPEDDDDHYDYNPTMERVTTILAILAGIAICAIIVFFLFRVFDVFSNDDSKDRGNPIQSVEESSSQSSQSAQTPTDTESEESEEMLVEMPAILGWNLGDARSILRDRYLLVEVEFVESDEYAADIVMEADIEAGEMVEPGTVVNLKVSSGVSLVGVPGTLDMTYESAYTILTQSGFTVRREEDYSDTVAAGNVISQIPAGGLQVEPGTEVVVTVSLGSNQGKVKVPNVIGMTEEEAIITLGESGFTVSNVSQVYNSEIAEGLVCYQSYSAGTYVEPKTVFKIHVSLGPGTYSYNTSIAMPTTEEAPSYVYGQDVNIVIRTDNGVELYNHTTSSFPQAVSIYGINWPTGSITFTYTVTTAPGVTEEMSFRRNVEFTMD